MAELSVQDRLEMTVAATLLAEPDWTGEAVSLIRPEDFTEEGGCAEIFAAIRSLFLDGRPVTPMAVTLAAGDWTGPMVKALGQGGLAAVTREELRSLCESLQSRARTRRVSALAGRLATTAEPELAAHLVEEINGAMVRRQAAKAVTMAEAAVDFVTKLEEKPLYLPWGIPKLDETLLVEPGDFVVIGGYPSAGKTLLALQMALVLAEHYRTGFFSLETSTRKLFDRLMARASGVSLKRIKTRALRSDDADRLTRAAIDLEKLPLELIHAAGMTVSDIRAVALQRRYEVVFVDYLQLIPAPGKNRTEQVTAISIGLHTMAQRHGVTVIALAQLTRPERVKGKAPPPSMQSFRESGQIEQDADVAMLLYPKDPDDNNSNRILKISKNKEGEKDKLELAFDGAAQGLTPVPEDRTIMAKLANEGRKAKQRNRQAAFEDLPAGEEVPF